MKSQTYLAEIKFPKKYHSMENYAYFDVNIVYFIRINIVLLKYNA